MPEVHNLKKYKKTRQYLRNNATKSEKILWQELSNSKTGFKFRRQHSVRQYVIDLYCPEVRLAIEIDGEIHNNLKQQKSDYKKEQILNGLGIEVIRFHDYEIIEDVYIVVEKIKQICNNLRFNKTTPNPSLDKEGRDRNKNKII